MLAIQKTLRSHKDNKRAKIYSWFFKTGPGEYGEGDVFIGVTMPKIRIMAKNHLSITNKDLRTLLKSEVHEERMLALVILCYQFKKAKDNPKQQKQIFDFYFANIKGINNWDLVDVSCRAIVGGYHLDKNRKFLYDLTKSKNMWEQRIAIVSTLEFIRLNDLDDAFDIAKLLLGHKHDLMHKACGWVLREAGKKDQKRLETFLKNHYPKLPRTLLRYAIERFDEPKRLRFLKGKF
jgi:3-methyladenine DNA glycosylase AlkD